MVDRNDDGVFDDDEGRYTEILPLASGKEGPVRRSRAFDLVDP